MKEAKRREAELDSVLAIRTKDLAELEEGKKALLEQAPSKVTVVRHIMADLKALCRDTTKVNEMVNDKPFTKQRRRPNTSKQTKFCDRFVMSLYQFSKLKPDDRVRSFVVKCSPKFKKASLRVCVVMY